MASETEPNEAVRTAIIDEYVIPEEEWEKPGIIIIMWILTTTEKMRSSRSLSALRKRIRRILCAAYEGKRRSDSDVYPDKSSGSGNG